MPDDDVLAHAVHEPTLVITPPKVRVLVADDDPDVSEAICASLSERGHEAHRCASGNAVLDALAGHDFDVLVTELTLADMGGPALMERVRGFKPDVGVVVLTGRGTMDAAVSAMRA